MPEDKRGKHPNTLKNLKPFVKGDDPRRNVTGANSGSVHLKAKLKQFLTDRAEGKDTSYQDLYVKRLLSNAISKGNMDAIKLIWEAFEGKATQKHEVGGTVHHDISPEALDLADGLLKSQRRR